MLFKCHQIPKTLLKDIKYFLTKLENDDTFLFELQRVSPKIFSVEINFLSKTEIRIINNKFRNIDFPTDVLSFNLGYIGEIDLCYDMIFENSINYNIDFKEEVFRCIIHGSLHVLGYDHTDKLTPNTNYIEPMFIIQEEILKNVTSSSL